MGGPALLGGRLGLRCPGSLATLLTAPLDSGLRRHDEVRRRHDEVRRRHDESGGRRSWQAGLASDALEALPHSSPPLWIPAFAGMTKCGAGMTKWGAGMTNRAPALLAGRLGLRCPGSLATLPAAPLDSGLRRHDEVGRRHDEVGGGNDEVGGRRSWEAGLASDALEALPHSSPPLWIPAFAGMTKWGGRHDEVGRRNDESGGRRSWEAGLLASDTLEALPHSSPPLWIPAFAGMTKWGGRHDESGGRNDEVGGRRSWEAGLASDALEALPHSSPPLWIPAFAGMTKWASDVRVRPSLGISLSKSDCTPRSV